MEGLVDKLCDDVDVCSYYFGVVEDVICQNFWDIKYYKCCKWWFSQRFVMMFKFVLKMIEVYVVDVFDVIVMC